MIQVFVGQIVVEVEVEVSQYEDGEKSASAKMDANEIISKVRDFVDSIKETSGGIQPMVVGLDNFNFSIASLRASVV